MSILTMVSHRSSRRKYRSSHRKHRSPRRRTSRFSSPRHRRGMHRHDTIVKHMLLRPDIPVRIFENVAPIERIRVPVRMRGPPINRVITSKGAFFVMRDPRAGGKVIMVPTKMTTKEVIKQQQDIVKERGRVAAKKYKRGPNL